MVCAENYRVSDVSSYLKDISKENYKCEVYRLLVILYLIRIFKLLCKDYYEKHLRRPNVVIQKNVYLDYGHMALYNPFCHLPTMISFCVPLGLCETVPVYG